MRAGNGETQRVASQKTPLGRTLADDVYDRYRTLIDAQPRRVDADFEKAMKVLKDLEKQHK